MVKLLLLVVLSAIFAVGYAKHIHPRNVMYREEDPADDSEQIGTDIEGTPIDMLTNMKQSRFVPVNNVLYFMTMRYPPCQEGFKRDRLGVCREVWD